MMSRLVLTAVDGTWSCTVPSGTKRVLGRASGQADVVLRDLSVARRHAVVFEQDHVWHIEDLGSHCGIYVNDVAAVGSRRLAQGDTVRIGAISLVVAIQDDAGPV